MNMKQSSKPHLNDSDNGSDYQFPSMTRWSSLHDDAPILPQSTSTTANPADDYINTPNDSSLSQRSQSRPKRNFVSTSSNHEALDNSNNPIKLVNLAWLSSKYPKDKFGTINGVFLPCLQNFLNVILFLRLTSIMSQAGCIYTTLIIIVCVTSTLITSISISAIATNGTICDGGPYYIISRTLGLEIGGALGLLFYLGNTIATSINVMGAVEAIMHTIGLVSPGGENGTLFPFDTELCSYLLMLIIATVISVGNNKFVDNISNIILALVLVSLFSMCLGCLLFAHDSTGFMGDLYVWDRLKSDNLWPRYSPDPATGVTPTFYSLLALFYPSVTGVLAGTNRSASLADPARSIPRGTITALFCTTFIYLFVVWLFGLTVANYTLQGDKFVVAKIAYPSSIVVEIGVIMSSIGAALQSIAIAPTLLAAIAVDGSMPVLSHFILKGNGGQVHQNNIMQSHVDSSSSPRTTVEVPKRALWITWLIASLPTLAGNIDFVSPTVTMFFLFMYSGINFSCFLLGVTKSPGFRPTFPYFNHYISFLGFVWCIGLALIIDFFIACISMILLICLFVINKRQKAQRDWGDVFDSVKYNIATSSLRQLSHTTTEHLNAKNWRPQVLTLVDVDNTTASPINLHLLRLASQFQKGRGINMVVSIITSDYNKTSEVNHQKLPHAVGLDNLDIHERINHCKSLLQDHMADEDMEGFANVSTCPLANWSSTIWTALMHSGLGPLSPNTILLSYPSKEERHKSESFGEEFVCTLLGVTNMRIALLLFKGCEKYPSSKDVVPMGCIDVWWVVHDGGLLLLLPFILSKNSVWGRHGAILRIFALTTTPTENPEKLREAVEDHLSQARISAKVIVVDMSETSIANDMLGSDENHSIGTNMVTQFFSNCISSTHDRTVGEVFMNESYEVPYTNLRLDNVEQGQFEYNNYISTEPEPITTDAETILNPLDLRRRTAITFNMHLKFHSRDSNLVVINMPHIGRKEKQMEFFDYIDTVTSGIENVLLIKGSGNEVITTYA